ncbi:MAG: prephenate dehydratase [archaeon]|jgi:chorismate mutase/prephenate dehydratase
MIIAFFGPETTYTHQAALKQFGENNKLKSNTFVAKRTIPEVFESVEKGEAEFGVVPIENSTEGSVAHTLDSFVDSNLKIIAEIVTPIQHCLLSNSKVSEITKIYSHPQPLGQCKKYLRKNFPNAELIEALSTANAAMLASKEKNSAAIASELAGKKFGVKVVEKEINDEKNNLTRFFVIGNDCTKATGKDKTTLLFSTKNVSGALYNVLGVIAKHKLNMTKIESRPSKKKTWEVVFFVEIEGHENDINVSKALKEMNEYCEVVKVLGSYPAKTKISD